MVDKNTVLITRNSGLFANFPDLFPDKLSDFHLNNLLLAGRLFFTYQQSGTLWVKSGFYAYHDTDCTDEPILYVGVRYPYESEDTLRIVLPSARVIVC